MIEQRVEWARQYGEAHGISHNAVESLIDWFESVGQASPPVGNHWDVLKSILNGEVVPSPAVPSEVVRDKLDELWERENTDFNGDERSRDYTRAINDMHEALGVVRDQGGQDG